MACLRGITKRVNLLQRRVYPSCNHLLSNDKDESKSPSPNSSTMIRKIFAHNETYKRQFHQSFSGSLGIGLSSSRFMSSTPEWSNKVDGIDLVSPDVIPVETVMSTTSQAAVSSGSEVAIAAADSFYPVAWLQYVIDNVHSFTGLNWWASIALTTVVIRGVTVPLLLSQLKATYTLTLLRPKLEALRQEVDAKAEEDPEAAVEGQKRMLSLFKQHGVSPLTPVKGLFIQAPIFISFFLAIRNMAEKVPSFKTGGTLWFTDLSTPDTTYILPLLTAASFLIMVEANMQDGLEGNPVAGTMKKFSRIVAVVSIPVLIGIEKALFCYWLTSNLFSLGYGLAIKRPAVRKFLNLPDVVVSPTTQPSRPFSMPFSFMQPKDQSIVQEKPSMPSSESSSSVPERRISRSSVLHQRIRTLEREIKSQKNKK